MQTHDYLNKEFIEAFYYNTRNTNREDEVYYESKGRKYSKRGEYQPVYFAGVLHDVENLETHKHTKMLLVGIKKCPTYMLDVSEKAMYACAEENAYTNPYMVIKDVDEMDDLIFEELMSSLTWTLKLKFMMTPEEVEERNNQLECAKFFCEGKDANDWENYHPCSCCSE